MKHCTENDSLVIFLEGQIDSSNARAAEEEIGRILGENPGRDIIFDADKLDYISSAGLRVLLAVHKKTENVVLVRNASAAVYEILDVTGFATFMDVKRKPREISVEGCPLIGKGAVGEVYRLDADTIVKVYNIDNSLPTIENEQKRSRQAFLKGIPTAIPFDIVKVGGKYGFVFEMIKAVNCNDMLAENPGRVNEIAEMYAGFLHQVHGALSEPGELPDARDEYIRYLDAAAGVLSDELCRRIGTLIREMPKDLHIIHGDIHLKNVMYSNGDMILIDMETLSCGNPVFDFAGLYVTYIAFGEDDPGNSQDFLGLPQETCAALFRETLRRYLDPADEDVYRQALDSIMLLGYVRFLYLLDRLGGGSPECSALRTAHTREHLEELAVRVTALGI